MSHEVICCSNLSRRRVAAICRTRMQEAGKSYYHYRTVRRQLADRCEFETITADQILRDKLVFGIQDSKVRERWLREKNLSLQKTDEICRAQETTTEQMKVAGGVGTGDTDSGDLNAFRGTQPPFSLKCF